MADQYKITSTSRNTAKVEDKVISASKTTQKIVRSEIIDNNPKNPEAAVKVSVVHQKIGKDGWEDIKGQSLASMKAGDIMKLNLSSEETLELYKLLHNLYLIHGDKGVSYGVSEVVIGFADEIIKTDPKRAEVIRTLVEQGHSEEVWQQLIEANNFAAGQVETVQNFALTAVGEYKIRVYANGRNATDYAIMITSSESYTFIFRGVMEYGDLQEATSKANNDHFWHFRGQEGDVISINLSPMDESDLFLELYGPDAERISEFIDDGTSGEAESIVDFVLPATGLYSIRIGEFDFLSATYEIELLSNDLSQRLFFRVVM